ncbi:hypothetical protein KC332_g7872 [Hortaea werneckii]|nr:hypothetical protein KC358_g8014 [Hortaea werneckii]KAI6834210.1 hypothetical protein KC350_g6774 [Hortaea werneckii]KAI6836214.1 hypothetical protein KC342_g5240 [Hortaea werneckii]KAI6929639.1 hypothetical protein KC348_g7813 [Hortaea werneckii]KAI6933793.1 hypothetical protein KC341_g8040 [Hortaea werneckii]
MTSKRLTFGKDPDSSNEFKTKYSKTISIVVGNNYWDPFNVHESLLVTSSEVFKAALSADWKENRLKVIHLSCHRPVNFQIYLDWLYGRGHVNIEVLVMESLADSGTTAPGEKDPWVVDQLCELWILGDYLLDNEFKNAVIESILCLVATDSRMILPDTVERIVDGTLTDSGLYRWLLDRLASVLTPNDLEKIEYILPQSVLLPLLKKCQKYHEQSRENTAETERDEC